MTPQGNRRGPERPPRIFRGCIRPAEAGLRGKVECLLQKEKHRFAVLFLLEQGTGIEPASTAWEAVVLPMY